MAVLLTDADEGLFDRLGRIFKIVKNIEGWQAGAATSLDQELADVIARYGNDLDLASGLTGSLKAMQTTIAGVYSILSRTASRTVIEMVDDDDPLPALDLDLALERLIEQMIGSGTVTGPDDDVDGNVVSLADPTADAANTGTGVAVGSVFTTFGAKSSQHLRAESIVIRCTRDSQEGQTVAGREIFSVKGEAAITDTRDPNWPGGSGINATIQVSDPAENAQKAPGKNLLHNSAMETFTVANTLDNWTASVGTFGTDFLEEGTTVFRGSKSLEMVGDGSTLNQMSQAFGTAGATLGKLKPETNYYIHFMLSGDPTIAAGVLRVSVKDGSDNILDGGSAAVSESLIGQSATWTAYGANFLTPKAMPTGTKCVLEFTTALESGKVIHIDDLIVCEIPHLGAAQGPGILVLPGATAFVRDDEFVGTVANSGASEFHHYFDMFFDMYGRGRQLPYDTGGTETIADTLIT